MLIILFAMTSNYSWLFLTQRGFFFLPSLAIPFLETCLKLSFKDIVKILFDLQTMQSVSQYPLVGKVQLSVVLGVLHFVQLVMVTLMVLF